MSSRFLPASRLVFAFCLFGPGAGLHAAFELAGELPVSFGDGPVVVQRESLEERGFTTVASGSLVNGRLQLRVDAEPGLFALRLGEAQVPFVAGDGQALRVSFVDGKGLQVDGGPDQALYAAYENFRTASLARGVLAVRAAIRAAGEAGNTAEVDRLTVEEVRAYREHRHELNDFTLEKLRGSPALYAASLRWDGDYRLDELAAVVRDYAERNPGSGIAQLMEARIARFRATAIGAVAPDLTGPSPTGGTVNLRDLRGRHVLVDFWASWCAPCRIENRHYAELHRRYRDAGFEILAVSVDQNGNAWKAAIAKDEASWLHLSDLSGWKSPLAAAYNVTALPASFLLDPEGRIIAKDLRGEPLAAALAARLKAKAGPPAP